MQIDSTPEAPEPVIRAALAAEAERLSDLMRSTFLDANGHCSTPANVAAFLDAVYSPATQRREIADPDILTWIVESPHGGGAWAGFAQLRFATRAPEEVGLRHPVELGRIYLAPSFQGRGLARTLMLHLCDEARRRGADGLWLNVWQEATQAIRFYTKHGFRIVGRSIFTVGDDPKDDWVMVRALYPD
ncbi:MAG: GNAT family N-acetyltransferase [Luteimonas sp.]|nr:GNAT family N-acetyltransferase [Luteimonas sp.]